MINTMNQMFGTDFEMKKIEKSHNYIKKRHKYEKSESILRK